MQAWIQSSDLSSRDLNVDADGAIEILESHDWAGEESRRQALESGRKDCCPAGLGLVSPRDGILHLCPDGVSTTIYWMEPYKLGFIKMQRTHTWKGVPSLVAHDAIRHHYGARRAQLLEVLVAYK